MEEHEEALSDIPPGVVLDGSYDCQYCQSYATSAMLILGTLTWRCAEGHLSLIEDFPLDL